MNSFTIKDLESLSGIKAHTIRIWEQRYSFLKPQRTGTNIRYYSSEELKTILNIALLNKYGFKISHIDKMDQVEISQRLFSLTDSLAQQEKLVNDLIGNMIDMDIDHFESILNRYIKARGIERAILQLIFPFLERIGILWQTNHINPGQEHLVTNVIRQKLLTGIDNAAPLLQSSKSILLFLPEGEYHELGLLYMYYLLKIRGVRVFYLGANVPARDVAFVATIKKPDYLYSHITYTPGSYKLEKYLSAVREKVAECPLILSGNLGQLQQAQLSNGVQFKKSTAEIMEFVGQF